MKRKSLIKAGMVALAGVLVLSGCVRYDTQIEIKSDGKVDVITIVAADEQFAAEMGATPEDLYGDLSSDLDDAELKEQFGDRYKYEAYSQDGYKGFKMSISDATLEELNGSVSGEVGLGGGITFDGDKIRVSLPTEEFAAGGEGGEMTVDDMAQMTAMGLDFKIAYKFPGAVESTTAGTIEGNTVVLTLNDLMTATGSSIEIVATGGAGANSGSGDNGGSETPAATPEPGVSAPAGSNGGSSSSDEGGSNTGLFIGIGAAVLVAAGVIAYVVSNNKKKAKAAAAAQFGYPQQYAQPGQVPPGYPAAPPAPQGYPAQPQAPQGYPTQPPAPQAPPAPEQGQPPVPPAQ